MENVSSLQDKSMDCSWSFAAFQWVRRRRKVICQECCYAFRVDLFGFYGSTIVVYYDLQFNILFQRLLPGSSWIRKCNVRTSCQWIINSSHLYKSIVSTTSQNRNPIWSHIGGRQPVHVSSDRWDSTTNSMVDDEPDMPLHCCNSRHR